MKFEVNDEVIHKWTKHRGIVKEINGDKISVEWHTNPGEVYVFTSKVLRKIENHSDNP